MFDVNYFLFGEKKINIIVETQIRKSKIQHQPTKYGNEN